MLLDCTLPGGLDPQLVPMADEAGVPVILMSGHPDMMERVPGAGRPFIQKPFSLSSLLKTFRASSSRAASRPAAMSRKSLRATTVVSRCWTAETSAPSGNGFARNSSWPGVAAGR